MKYLLPSLRMLAWLTLLTGVIYPLLITGIGYMTMRQKSEGSFIYENNKVVGSALIGQKFESIQYFWPRPSAHNYDALTSGGTNYGPTSKELKKAIQERQTFLMKAHKMENIKEIPAEILFASGSGLDPHINSQTAKFQIKRIAQARNLEGHSGYEMLENLIDSHTQHSFLGFTGVRYVNVLELNIALDKLETSFIKDLK